MFTLEIYMCVCVYCLYALCLNVFYFYTFLPFKTYFFIVIHNYNKQIHLYPLPLLTLNHNSRSNLAQNLNMILMILRMGFYF